MESPRSLSELLGRLDRAAEEAEKALGCEILILAFHDYASIDRSVVDDLEFFVRRRGRREDLDLCVVLHTGGGDADAAYHVAIRLQDLAGEKRLVAAVPRLAKSAGTIIACAGDAIYATPITELGPVDPQVYLPSTGRYVSARTIRDSLRQAIETLREAGAADPIIAEKALSSIPIAEMGDFESLLNHVKNLLKEVLSRRMKRDKEEAEAIAETLTRGYEYHGKVIHVDEARRIGLNIEVLSGEKLDAVYELYENLRELLDAVDEVLKPLPHELAPPPSLHKIKHGLVYLPLPPTRTELSSHPASGEASEAGSPRERSAPKPTEQLQRVERQGSPPGAGAGRERCDGNQPHRLHRETEHGGAAGRDGARAGGNRAGGHRGRAHLGLRESGPRAGRWPVKAP